MNQIIVNIPTAVLWVLTATLLIVAVTNSVKAYLEYQVFKARVVAAKHAAALAAANPPPAEIPKPGPGPKSGPRSGPGRKRYGH